MTKAASIFDESDDITSDEVEEEDFETEPENDEVTSEPAAENDSPNDALLPIVERKKQIESLQDQNNEDLKKIYESHGNGPWLVDGQHQYIRKHRDSYFLLARKPVIAVKVFDDD